MLFCFNAGGLTAVIYTDALQTVIMVVGAFVLMFIGIDILFNVKCELCLTKLTALKMNFPWQHSTKWGGMRVCWISMRKRYLLLRFLTPLVICLVPMPFTSSEIRWRGTFPGRVWSLGSRFWPHGCGAQTRWQQFDLQFTTLLI